MLTDLKASDPRRETSSNMIEYGRCPIMLQAKLLTHRLIIEHVVLRAADGEPEHCISLHVVPLRLNVDQV